MTPEMTIHMKNGARIRIALELDKAFNGGNGLLKAVHEHLFQNMAIARIVPGFVLQPWYDESVMPEPYQYLAKLEWDGTRSFDKYSVGLAGDGKSIASVCCFFIVAEDGCQKRLNGKFTYLGKVVSGYAEVDRLMHVELIKDESPENVEIYHPAVPEIIADITADVSASEAEYVLPKDINMSCLRI